MAQVFNDNFERGVKAGIDRARIHGVDVSRTQIDEPLNRTRVVIQSWPANLSHRFQEVFVEDITIASASRVKYNDQALQDADLRASLGFWERIFNSFAHLE